ncbi:hypothetical protein L209DRAFT_754667 [Thermothelomyces heterothallicus CBS 203.75]
MTSHIPTRLFRILAMINRHMYWNEVATTPLQGLVSTLLLSLVGLRKRIGEVQTREKKTRKACLLAALRWCPLIIVIPRMRGIFSRHAKNLAWPGLGAALEQHPTILPLKNAAGSLCFREIGDRGRNLEQSS